MVAIGSDPFLVKLRDVLGVLRVMVEVTSDPTVERALAAMQDACDVAQQDRREKELGRKLTLARRALREALEAVPEQATYLKGCLGRMPTMRGGRSRS